MKPEPAVLLLHPLPFDARAWDSVRPGLADFPVYAPTIYDLGDSLEEIATAILGSVDEERLVVVGNSIGGSCAIEVAAAAPERVEHLVLIGTKAGHRPDPDYQAWAQQLLATAGIGAIWDEVWAPLFARASAPAIVAAARELALAIPASHSGKGIDLFHSRRDLTAVVDSWHGGLTAVSGAEDTAPGPQRARDLARRAARGRFVLIEDCGHYVPLERPGRMAAIVNDVVSSLS